MAPFPEEVAVAPVQGEPEISVLKQRVDLDIDFTGRSLKGSTEITIQPLVRDIRSIKLHCRQCRPTAIQVGGITAKWEYHEPYRRLRMHRNSTAHQHEMLTEQIESSLRPAPSPELEITLPPKFKIQELQADSTVAMVPAEIDGNAVAGNATSQLSAQQGPQFAPIKVSIEFETTVFRDGLHWIGHAEGDRRYPYVYTKVEPCPGNSSSIFPCVDDATSRCSWEISIRCARTLGDAFRLSKAPPDVTNDGGAQVSDSDVEMTHGSVMQPPREPEDSRIAEEYLIDLAAEEAALDLAVVCVGDVVDDVPDSDDETRHTVSFKVAQPVTARHIGFAIGPFERVNLSTARGSEEEERLGQTAVKVDAYCLPGKSRDLVNTCYPIPWAIDNMSIKYGSFPFTTYHMLFVDDFAHDAIATAGLSFCSASLLFPNTVIEPIYRNTRILVRALADQWIGVNVIAKDPSDEWVVAGIAGFMTDAYMKDLCGNNEFRWQQKLAAEKVYELDVDRPSIMLLGSLLHLDDSIREFVNIKSALVLFILDRRLMKTTGQTGVQRIINRIFLNAKTGALVNGEVSTMDFQRTCERLGHNKLESFFRQWVFQSGCPIFYVTQRFNKKKLVVEMTIVQKQLERVTKPPFDPSSFMREVKEHVQEVWAPETNPVFTGPMTIRIHEADGTPYEHIVEIKEALTKLEIPYNTKYKRLKRSRKQKERQMAEGVTVEGGEDALLFCLGDKYQTEEEKREWNLVDWTEEDEEKMGQESYEWIRMDADFEWIGKIHLVMPLYMYVSQLQQDRDIVAQYESMRYLLGSNPHHVSLSILTRTLMDDKYFWGIREMAAEGLAICAKDRWREIGQFHLTKAFRELFCIGDTNMPRSNNFSDRRNFVIQCAIPKAMAKLRDESGKVPMPVRQFFVDLLKFNDNTNNIIRDGEVDAGTYSDHHYVATLMKCLSDALEASHREAQPTYSFNFGDEETLEPEEDLDGEFEKLAIAQIERHRRIDEWDPSYQNIYSITALECLQQLTKAGIVKDKSKELMQYVRIGNADNVRLAAWRCLSEIGVTRKMSAMKYMLHCLGDDPSPYFRVGLLKIFGEALGHIALGDLEPVPTPAPPPVDGGLIVEQDPSTELRRLEIARKTTPDGAIEALKTALVNEDAFKEALWNAVISSHTTLEEIGALCDIAALVFEPISSLFVRLRLPRLWKCEDMGQGKVRFLAHGPHRTVPRRGLALQDWKRAQELGLNYAGTLSVEVSQHQKDAQAAIELKLKIAQKQQELEQAQNHQALADMAPPSLVTPTIEKPPVPKLSLSMKRKTSVDLGATARASSPKAPKLSRQATPTSAVQQPRPRSSPSATQRRSSTPSSRASAGKAKPSKILKLRFDSKTVEFREMAKEYERKQHPPASRPLANRKSATPTLPQPSTFQAPFLQSPKNSMNYFDRPNPVDAISNVGLFRSYATPVEVDTHEPVVKREETPHEIVASPVSDDEPLAIAARQRADEKPSSLSSTPTQQDMPPPPPKKLTLKLGSRKPSSS